MPLAYLITFTTYGTWLHGDPRGSVDLEHNVPDTPYLDPNPRRLTWERGHARRAPLVLDAVARPLVEAAVLDVCSHRDWTLHAVNVRTNHVHVVVSAPVRPEGVLHDLKAYATRVLRQPGRIAKHLTPWTAGGSTRYLWDRAAVTAACAYVGDQQGVDI